MKNYIANKIEDILDALLCAWLATKWFRYIASKKWYHTPGGC